MHWYDGSIAEAVTLSKQRNSIFVVFVEDDNELSQEMATTLDEAAVQKRLADPANFLAVKLKSGSETYVHFARMYQFVPVPSVFFIGRNGTPLEVVCAGVQPDDLASRIDRILAEHQKGKPPGGPAGPPAVEPSTSGQQIRQQTASLIQAEATTPEPTAKTREREEEPETSAGPASKVQKTEHHEVTASGQEYDVVCDGDVCVRVPKKTDAGPSGATETSPPSTEPAAQSPVPPAAQPADTADTSEADKLERARHLIEIKRREKAEKEKELERQKELERRSTGQGVAELKRWQADQEMKQLQDERRREKLENQQARQRVLDQIAQDRAERRAREQPANTPAAAQEPHTPSAAATTSTPPVGDGGGRARIQFKLPDGTSHTQHFDAESPLSTVQRYVADNLQLTPNSFTLWTAFPRRELTAQDSSLRELELAPSAALLVISRRSTSSPVARNGALQTLLSLISQLVTTIFAAPGNLWSWFWSAPPPAGPPEDPRGPVGPTPPAPRAPGLRYRPPTNIHRLTGDNDRPADDDNNTWNGNSTQQM